MRWWGQQEDDIEQNERTDCLSLAKGRSRKKRKSPVNWIEIAVQFLTGLITGIIILIIDKLWK